MIVKQHLPATSLLVCLLFLSVTGCQPAPNPKQPAGNAPASPVSETAASEQPMLSSLQIDAIWRIELEYAEETIILEQVPGGWRLPLWRMLPADQVYAGFLMNVLQNMSSGTVVASDQKEDAAYELDQPFVRIRLKDRADATLATIGVGKAADSYRSAYVRLNNQPEVRLLHADLIPATSRPGWVSREIWRIPEKLVTGIIYQGSEQSWRLVSENGVWRVVAPEGAELQEAFPEELLPKLAWLRAGYARYQAEASPGDGPTLELEAVGTKFLLKMGTPLEGKIAVRQEGLPVTWYLSEDFETMLQSGVIKN